MKPLFFGLFCCHNATKEVLTFLRPGNFSPLVGICYWAVQVYLLSMHSFFEYAITMWNYIFWVINLMFRKLQMHHDHDPNEKKSLLTSGHHADQEGGQLGRSYMYCHYIAIVANNRSYTCTEVLVADESAPVQYNYINTLHCKTKTNNLCTVLW